MIRPNACLLSWLIASAVVALSSSVRANPGVTDEPGAEAATEEAPLDVLSWPRVGGHLGLALPFVTFSNDGTSAIGRDFAQVGVTPGMTVKLTEQWAIDFEFIGFGRWELYDDAPDVSRTIFVVDPGVVYNFGPVSAGLRLAVAIGDPMNYGIVPIFVVPFEISKGLSYFLELDVPVAVTAVAGSPAEGGEPATDDRVVGSATIQLQTGFAF